MSTTESPAPLAGFAEDLPATLLARLAGAQRLLFVQNDAVHALWLPTPKDVDAVRSEALAATEHERCTLVDLEGPHRRSALARLLPDQDSAPRALVAARLGSSAGSPVVIAIVEEGDDPAQARERLASASLLVARTIDAHPDSQARNVFIQLQRVFASLDASGRLCAADPGLGVLAGRPVLDLTGRPFAEMLEARCRARFQRHLGRLVPGLPNSSVYALLRAEGERIPALVTLTLARDGAEEAVLCHVRPLSEDEATQELVGRVATAIFPELGTTIRADRLLAETADALDLRLVAVATTAPGDPRLRIEMAAGTAVGRVDARAAAPMPTPWQQSFDSGETLVLTDLTREGTDAARELVAHDCQAFAGVPLSAPGTAPLGVLFALASTPRAFARFEIQSLRILAEFLSTDFDRRRAERKLERRAAELAALLEATRDLTQLREADRLLSAVVQRAIDLIPGADAGCLLFEDRGDLVPRHVRGALDADAMASVRIPVGGSALGRTYSEKRGILVTGSAEVADAAALAPENAAALARALPPGADLRKLLAVPLLAGPVPLAVLALAQHTRTEAILGRDLELLERFAGLAAAAIVQVRLFDAVRLRSTLVEAVREAVLAVDEKGCVTFSNEGAAAMFGGAEALRRRGALTALFTPADGAALEVGIETARREGHWVGFLRGLREGGALFDAAVALSKAPDASSFAAIVSDVTERRHLEAAALRAQTIESLGKLAAGIAHDFNNMLGSILGFTSLLRSRVPSESPLLHEIDGVERVTDQAAQLAQRLLVLGRTAPGTREATDVNGTVLGLAEVIRHTFDPSIELDLRLAPTPCVVEGDETAIRQALLNLVTNARDALPEGGRITLATEHVPSEGGGAPRIAVTVADNGVGMPPEVQRRIYEPFFTTKPQGKGTGLGCAIVFATVRAHGGSIELRSAPREGTAFRMTFPAATRTVHRRPEPPRASTELRRGSGTLLLVEDDPILRGVTADMAACLGYEVIAVPAGHEALRVARARGSSIDLVLLDLTMPGMSGPEVFHALRTLDPSMRIVLTTGFAAENAAEALLAKGAVALLPKPYRSADLARVLAEAMELPRESSSRQIV